MKNILTLFLVLLCAGTGAQAGEQSDFELVHKNQYGHKYESFQNWKDGPFIKLVTISPPFDLDSASAVYTSCIPDKIVYNASKTLTHVHQVSVSGTAKLEVKAELSNILLGALGFSGSAIDLNGIYMVQKLESLTVGPTGVVHPRCYRMSTYFTAKTKASSGTTKLAVWRGICSLALHGPVEAFDGFVDAIGEGTKTCCTEATTKSSKVPNCPDCEKQ